MQPQVFDYDPPDRFVAGTVGEPGHRTFYLQASGGGRVTSVALEKLQVAALAERVDEILDELLRLSGGTAAPAAPRHRFAWHLHAQKSPRCGSHQGGG